MRFVRAIALLAVSTAVAACGGPTGGDAARPPSVPGVGSAVPDTGPTPDDAPESAVTSVEPSPPPTPGQGRAMLRGWKLTLPVVGSKGEAALLDPARVSAPWLTQGDHGEMVFFAPVDGVTTRNSDHPRSELVGVDSWRAGSGRHALTVSAAVSRVPAESRDVIIGQIHGAGADKAVPFVMLHLEQEALTVIVKQQRFGSAKQTYRLLDHVPLGSWFTFGLADDGDGTLSLTATLAGRTGTASAPLPADFVGAEVRFQAGAYQLGYPPGDSDEDGARVAFASLTR